jgi:transposase
MRCERSMFSMLIRYWERRIGFRLHVLSRAFDPVKEITRRLVPNDHPEARRHPATSHRSLAWPFTPRLGLRLPQRGVYLMAFIGVDLHTNSFTICRIEADGAECFATFELSEAGLARFCQDLDADDSVAVEATGNAAYFRDQVLCCVGRFVVVNPKQFQVIRKSVNKTDRNDARALAFFLSKDMLPETRAKTRAEGELGSLAHTRDLLVKQRTRLLNKIHALFNRHGIKLKKESLGSNKALERLKTEPFSAMEKIEFSIVRDQALSLSAAIGKLDKEIETFAKTFDGYDGLTSIKGIGPRAAAVFLSAIGNVNDFDSADKLAAYFGIVPRVSQSNETDARGRITKRGNKLARTTLVQCTLIAIRYSDYLRACYQKVKARRGAGKAIIATARKLLAIVFNTLKNRWVFEDFTQFKIIGKSVPYGQSS